MNLQNTKSTAHRSLLLVCTSLTLAACASTTTPEARIADTSEYDVVSQNGIETQHLKDEARPRADAHLLAQTLVHFDFDQASVRCEYLDLLAAHARHLRTHPDMTVRLEGHADERGTREYNIALGERRAINVQRALMLQGVSQGQLNIISYGEEQPLATGRDEISYEQNRRVKINYLNRAQPSRASY